MGAIRRSDGVFVFQREGVGEGRRVEAGDITVEFGRAEVDVDISPLLRGLPDDMCQCRHQGYVVRGGFTCKTSEGSFDVAAGEAYDLPAGHTVVYHAGTEWVQITATADQRKTDAAIQRNAAATGGTQ